MPIADRLIKVLLIEDNSEQAESLERLLGFSEFPKFSVSVACTLADGLGKLKAGLEDLVLLDLGLPDSAGVETFRKVNAAVPEHPIVILSGISDVTTAIELVQQGAQDYLVKGNVDTQTLIRSIQYAIERKRAQVAVQNANTELENRVKERTAALSTVNDQLQHQVAERRHAEEQLLKSNRQLTVALAEVRAAHRPQPAAERSTPARPAAPVRELEETFKRIQQFGESILLAPAAMANPVKVAEHLKQILAAVGTGRKALRKTREITEVSVETFETIAADALVDRVLAIAKPKLEERGGADGAGISLVKQVDKGIEIEGDPVRLRDMLAELVVNAFNSIPKRGTVTVGAQQRGSEVILFVRDDGLGITEAARQRLLIPSADGVKADGRARGYATVHEVVARHRGRLEIESRKGLGTTVRVILPSSTSTKASSVHLRVLVVDDDPMIREVICAYLSEDGYSVELAANGREGLEKFCAGKFDLVLTDRTMPEMNGDQLAKEIKKRKPKVPVVLLTGHGDMMAATGEKPEGVDIVMSKPFTMVGLQETLAKFR
ncbi:MAG: response regulator [Chthoniobacteraceae bacterium]